MFEFLNIAVGMWTVSNIIGVLYGLFIIYIVRRFKR